MNKFHDEIQHLGRQIRGIGWLILLTATFLFLYMHNPSLLNFTSSEPETWTPKDPVAAFEMGIMPPEVKQGYLILTETSSWIGPDAEDPAMRYSGNRLSCTNCHLQAGTQAGSASWVGVADRFPQFSGRENREGSLADRINGCMERSMNGKAIAVDGAPMKAMVAYMEWLGEGIPEDQAKEYQGFPSLKLPEVAVNLEYGKEIFERECTVCHGADGQGIRKPDGKSYQYPPLWGDDTYNNGAGMHRVITAAEFIKGNMPFGIATKDNPKLSDEEAYHVAGYINSFSRPVKSNLDADYPDKKLKPVSTPYGPWTDDFTQEQHQFGPFQPIFAFYQSKYGIQKKK